MKHLPGLLLATAAWGHVVSMSSSDLAISGAQASLELRMPLYEVAHIPNPAQALLQHFRLRGADLVWSACQADASRDQYLCRATYRFPAPVETVEVECTLAAATVPNHVHLLRAEREGKRDQAVFDLSFTRATLRFRPPTDAETALRQTAVGAVRALGTPVLALFLVALVLAARARRELLVLAGSFLAGQIAAVAALPHFQWQPAPRFAEATAALALVYLAVEILALPEAGGRSMVAGLLGAFHGLYLHLVLQQSGGASGWALAGAVLAEITALALLALLLSRLGRLAQRFRPVQVGASALLVFGMAWFVMRLRG
jgi:hypothetical protein